MMKNEPSRPGTEPEMEPKWKTIGKRIIHSLTHQWGWKLISLVLAICLWGGLISQDTSLPRDKVIDDVKISVSNSNTLRNNGFIVVSGLDDLDAVRLRVRVPQRYYSTVTAANYTVRLDLSQIRDVGEQTVRLTASASNASMYGTVTEISLPEVKVQVEAYSTQNKVPVEVRVVGEMPEDYYLAPLSCSVSSVNIGGPQTVVDQVARCVVEFDQSTLSPHRNPNAANLPFFFEDASGNRLDDSHLTVTADGQSAALQRISVSQYAYFTAEVPVNTDFLIKGRPAEGYTVTNVRVTPQTVVIAGGERVISPYMQEGIFFYPYEQVDITDQNQDVFTYVTLRTPGNMEYISDSIVQVIVSIRPDIASLSFVETSNTTEQTQ